METSYHEEILITSSSEENNYKGDRGLELSLDSSGGVGRLYECVFCKRGFNTAQALGGHMNIHRKDRARNKPAATVMITSTRSNKKQEIYTSNHDHHELLNHDKDHQQELMLNYATYFKDSTSSTTAPLSDHYSTNGFHHQHALSPSVSRDWRVSSSLGFSPKLDVNMKEEELDLELRLGYDA